MGFALLLTSHVAASRVGGGVSASALQAAGIDTALVPTVLLGRHPGWGSPGGGAVNDAEFESQIDAIRAQGMFAKTNAILTGYFASVRQVECAAVTIDTVRAAAPREGNACNFVDDPVIVIDPIIGDAGGLYVREEIAVAIRDLLVPRADLVTPNAFELGWLTGLPVTDVKTTLAAVRAINRPVLASSIPEGDQIGVLYVDAHQSMMVMHRQLDDVPHGTGDLLTAIFLAELLNGRDAKAGLEAATSRVFDTVLKAKAWNSPELPDVTARLKPLDAETRLEARAIGG